MVNRLTALPARPFFSSGPCAKPPGWSAAALDTQSLGRSHRSTLGKARLQEAIERTHALLELPADYRLGLVPASDTGAMELHVALLGPGGTAGLGSSVPLVTDVVKPPGRRRGAPRGYGAIANLALRPGPDIVFTWNGTPAGCWCPMRVDRDDRSCLTFATRHSAAFAQDVDWAKSIRHSLQKARRRRRAGCLSSRRARRALEQAQAPRPLPKTFRRQSRPAEDGSFKGETSTLPRCGRPDCCSRSMGGIVGGLPR